MGILGMSIASGGCTFGVDFDGLFADASTEGSLPDTGIEGGPPAVLAIAVANGDGFTCALRVDSTVTCWGYNGGSGRLGNASDMSTSTPTLVKDLSDASAIAAGGAHACAIRKSGAVSCWGNNDYGQLGNGSTDSSRFPIPVSGLTDATQVTLGYNHTCALKKDATVVCWGANGSGQLGEGSTSRHDTPQPVPGLTDVTQLVAMNNGTCALVKTGDVLCWGENDHGQLGNGASPTDSSSPKKVSGLASVTAIGTGGTADHACAILGAGEIRCWGRGWDGALGNGDTSDHDTPIIVGLVTDAVSLTAGYSTSCALRKGGVVSCWGWNGWRQVGVGDNAPPYRVTTPIQVSGIGDVKQIANGFDHVCAVWGAGRISCWGSDVDGRLGRGVRLFSPEPLKAVGLTGLTAIGLGTSHGCAVSGGALKCWGANWDDQLTDDNAIGATGTPLAIPSLAANVKQTGSGNSHACVVMTDGTVKCWGAGYYGQLGQGASSSDGLPQVFGAGPAKMVTGGDDFTCAALETGEVACTGRNDNARLGRPGGNTNAPVRVQTDGTPTYLGGAIAVASGSAHSCAVSGTDVYCWGSSWGGQCGTTDDPTGPNKVALGAPAKMVAAGGGHSCALMQDGSVRCWGDNSDGQLSGSGGGPSPHTPTLPKAAKAIAVGGAHSCAVLDDGTVFCWGNGTLGQLGNGAVLNTQSPTQVKGITSAIAISARDDTTCVIVQDGSAWCWGENAEGELADGSIFTSGVPAAVVGY